MSVQRSEADAKIYKLFWGEHRPSVAFRLRGAELFSRGEAGDQDWDGGFDLTGGLRLMSGAAMIRGT